MPNIPSSVLITGGADGLGKALCLEFLSAGAKRVTVLDVDAEKGALLAEGEPRVDFHPVDLAAYASGEDETLGCGLGNFDTVICNAGISACGNFRDTPWEEERRLFEVNLFGHMRLVKDLLRTDAIETGGRLAFIVSASLFAPFPLAVAYAASKAGLDGFAHALEPYLIPQKISVTRIYPGTMRTAHQKKYYAGMNPSTGSDPAKIATKVVRGILRRKRHIYPDAMGRGFLTLSKLFPWAMPRLSHKVTKKYDSILYPEDTSA